MTRVLQIRRGTTADNDNFTGMPGEITMDTDNKTLRVHDGETLGGFALMRADNAANSSGKFDITTVSDEFWADVIAQHSPVLHSVYVSEQIPMNSKVAYSNCIVGDIPVPQFVRVALVCKIDQAGFHAGDEVWNFGIGEYANPCPNCFLDNNGVNVRLMVGTQAYWTAHHETGVRTELTDENWSILFRVYY